MATRPKSRVIRQSWATYDALVEKAFAKPDTPLVTPEPTAHPLEPDAVLDNALDPLWEKVLELKAEALEALPSKIKSLDVVKRETSRQEKERKGGVLENIDEAPDRVKLENSRGGKPPKIKRKSSATFCTSADGRSVTAAFDMLGVHKQDMHVSFRSNGIVITWRRAKTTEKVEDGTLIRERKEKQYCQTIPLPEGTRFEDVRASRDGQRLVITYPNSRCIRVGPSPTTPTGNNSGATSTTACSEDIEFQTCKLAPSTTLEVFEMERL